MKRFVSWKDCISYKEWLRRIVERDDKEAMLDIVRVHGSLSNAQKELDEAKRAVVEEAKPKTFEKKEGKKAWYDEQ